MSIRREDCRLERMPSEHDGSFIWSIKRASCESSLFLVLISDDIFGLRTHYFNRRTMPCLLQNCEPCERKHLSRWTGYIEALDVKNWSHVLFEFTPAGAVSFDQARRDRGTLRGLNVIAGRTSNKPNGKVQVTIKGMSDRAHTLPKEVDIWPILAHIWGLQTEAPPRVASHAKEELSEYERVREAMNQVPATDENAWMQKRAQDLAGQLHLALKNEIAETNGKAHD